MPTNTRRNARIVAALSLAAMCLLPAGCSIGALVGGMASSFEQTGTRTVKAKYDGLSGKSFAVVVAADRSVQGEYAEIVPLFTREITRRLADPKNGVNASGMVPADEVLNFQYRRPGWVAMSPADLAKELEVQRLIFIDLHTYELSEPGNPYVWSGAASGVINVLEADSRTPDDFKFHEIIHVKFPDNEGMTSEEIPRNTVALELARRFIERTSWLFFQHEEPKAIKY